MVLPSESLESPWSEPEMPPEPATMKLWIVVSRFVDKVASMVLTHGDAGGNRHGSHVSPFWWKIEIKDSKERTIIQSKLNLMKLLLFLLVNKDRHPCPVFHLKVFSNVTSHRWLEASILMIWAVVYIIRRMTKSEDAETATGNRNGNLFFEVLNGVI